MRHAASATALEFMKDTTVALLIVVWNIFKGCLTLLFLMLAWFAAWGVWEKGALSFGTVGVIAFLLLLASAPWVVPRMQLPNKPAPRTIAICGAALALVCLDLAYSALTYGWKPEECSAPGVLFCYGMNLLHAMGGNKLIAVWWVGAAGLILRATFKAVAHATREVQARVHERHGETLGAAV